MQESSAIAKKTVRCALHMDALKNFGSPWLRPRLLFLKLLIGFVVIDRVKVRAKFEVRSFTRSWDNRGYFENLGSPWIRPCSLFCKIFNGFLFAWTLRMYRPNLKSVTLPIPEIIRGTWKHWAAPGYTHTLFSAKILMGFCMHGLWESTGQIWSP